MKNIDSINPSMDEAANAIIISAMDLSTIAKLVSHDWKKVNFGAVPYLNAMRSMNSVNDDYGMDSGRSVVLYFLCNAQTWRGPIAKAVKKELNARVKG